MLPWIGKGLSKIPYFRRKIKSTLTTEEIPESITEQEPVPSLDDIRSEQLQNKAKQQEEKLNIALDYTRKTFAPYVSNGYVELLCGNVKIYADKLGLENLQPIKINNDLVTIDIYHFGWNIWNHFQVSDQMQVARFLKIVFAHTFRGVEDIVENINNTLTQHANVINRQEKQIGSLSQLQKKDNVKLVTLISLYADLAACGVMDGKRKENLKAEIYNLINPE
jgi:hypothetical protein